MLTSNPDALGFPISGMPVLEDIRGNVSIRGNFIFRAGSPFYTRFVATAPTAIRTITIPDVSGTMAFGTGANTGVAYWNSTNTLTYSGNITTDGTTLNAYVLNAPGWIQTSNYVYAATYMQTPYIILTSNGGVGEFIRFDAVNGGTTNPPPYPITRVQGDDAVQGPRWGSSDSVPGWSWSDMVKVYVKDTDGNFQERWIPDYQFHCGVNCTCNVECYCNMDGCGGDGPCYCNTNGCYVDGIGYCYCNLDGCGSDGYVPCTSCDMDGCGVNFACSCNTNGCGIDGYTCYCNTDGCGANEACACNTDGTCGQDQYFCYCNTDGCGTNASCSCNTNGCGTDGMCYCDTNGCGVDGGSPCNCNTNGCGANGITCTCNLDGCGVDGLTCMCNLNGCGCNTNATTCGCNLDSSRI